MAVTNAVSWRSEGIRYKKNEVFLDVVESVNLLVNSNGTVVRSEVVGALKMRTFLSGMPECKLGLNDKVRPSYDAEKASRAQMYLSLHDCYSLHGGLQKSADLSEILVPLFMSTCREVTNLHTWKQVLFEAQGRGGKNKSVDLEDMKFHQCVRLARFENDRTISFIPPDGAFDLM